MSKVLDLEVIQGLRELDPDDPEFLKRIVQLFLNDVPVQLEKLKNSIDASDAPTMGKLAHGLLSSAQNLGVTGMSELLRELETLGQSGSTQNASQTFQQLVSIFNEAKTDLENLT